MPDKSKLSAANSQRLFDSFFPCFKKEFSSFQLVPYRSTDDKVVHLKRLGNKVLVDLYQSNPLIVI